jgi:hypothetical protein
VAPSPCNRVTDMKGWCIIIVVVGRSEREKVENFNPDFADVRTHQQLLSWCHWKDRTRFPTSDQHLVWLYQLRFICKVDRKVAIGRFFDGLFILTAP